MAIDHYENFPVASWLCPAAIRPAVQAIYHFARTADDLADEGDVNAAQRLVDLRAYRADLRAVAKGELPSARFAPVFTPLAAAMAQYQLPAKLLEDLLSAFELDVRHTAQGFWYANHQELLAYAHYSANPVGRLLLHLYGVQGKEAERESDAVCSALQLINFWQDISVDVPRQRYYLPIALLSKYGVSQADVHNLRDTPAMRQLLAELCAFARQLMLRARALPGRIGGQAGLELRLVMAGGLRILDKIAAQGYNSVQQRPSLAAGDAPALLRLALFLPQASRASPQR
ncbi:MAG: squalene synthase HpnC [Brachymonas sp.]|jgi:squalene synthase HpnC